MDIPTSARTRIETLKAHHDPRGSIFEPLTDDELAAQKNVHVVLTQPNEIRGNHSHPTSTEISAVVGPCLVRLKEGDSLRDVEVPKGETWRFIIPPGVVHAYRNTGDAVMVLISFSTNIHEPSGTNTVREVIL